jgi:hypothetical protein
MTAIEKILLDYDTGTITKRERVIALARLITPETVNSTLASLPEDLAQELLDWARTAPLEGGVVIGGELSGEVARKLAGQVHLAVRAVRAWEEGRARGRSDNSSGETRGTTMPNGTNITNDIHRQQKLFFIRPGRYHLFGTDFEARDNMPDEQAIRRFDEVWDAKIKDSLLTGDPIEYEEALGLIGEAARAYCRRNQEQRKFRLAETVFVAQLEKRSDGFSHNQLWAVAARNYDTRSLFVTFPTQDDRSEWNRLATRLGFRPEDLGVRVLLGFLNTFASSAPAEDA